MVTKATEELIRAAIPGAKIIKNPSNAGKRAVIKSDSVTPDAAALIRKYGGSQSDVVRSRVILDAPLTATPADALEVAIVEVKAGDSSVPERLRRRTVIVNKRLGKIVGTSG